MDAEINFLEYQNNSGVYADNNWRGLGMWKVGSWKESLGPRLPSWDKGVCGKEKG